ncbi:hypothetical protein Tco_1425565, partial [Tanacetum coccineum]
MVWIKALSPNQLTTKMSVLHCLMMSHGGELLALYHDLLQSHREYVQLMDSRLKGYQEKFVSLTRSKAKGNERKKKIKSFTKSLYNLHAEVARMSADLNQATVLKAKRDEEILRLKATPSDRVQAELLSLAANAGFERGLSMHQTKEEFAAVLKKISQFVPGAQDRLAKASPWDACVSPPIMKELTVTLASTSLELLSNTVPTSSTATLEPKKEWVNAMVDGSDQEMTDGAANAKPRSMFVKGASYVVDDATGLTVVGSERVSSGPNDVVVALSTREKGDGYVPSSVVDEEGRVVCQRTLVAPSLGKTDCRCVVVHPADPELPSFLSIGVYWYMFPLRHCCSSELFARKEDIAMIPLKSLYQSFRVSTLPSHMYFTFIG